MRNVANPSPWKPRIMWCHSLFVDLGMSRNERKVGAWLSFSGCESVSLSIAC